MQVIAVTSVKGGVGKTTTALNLAYLAAAAGSTTLLWDLDPQGAATWLLQGVPNADASAKKLVLGKRELPELIAPTAYERLNLLPSDFSYRNFDVRLHERKRPTEQLIRMTRVLRDRYAFLFLDCPTGTSLLVDNAVRAADAILVPIVPSQLSVRAFALLGEHVAREGWFQSVLLPFFSMVSSHNSPQAEVIATARGRFPTALAAQVPYSTEIEQMSGRRQPLPAYAPTGAAARAYQTLWAEVLGRLDATTGTAPGVPDGVKVSPATVESEGSASGDAVAGVADGSPKSSRA